MENRIIEGKIVDVVNRRIFEGRLTVVEGIIEKIEEKLVESSDYILPGLIDSHIHIESSMLVPSEFARTAVKFGTIATVSDPHEIANVLGIDGVYFMIDNGAKVPMKFYFGAPSCVPATPFETSGGKITTKDIDKLLIDDRIHYLSEMMNFPGVLFDIPDVWDKLSIAKKHGKPIDGHAPGLNGSDAEKYVNAGISTDHECFSIEEAQEKISLGMKILIREGSAAKNFEALHTLIASNTNMVMLCSDDLHPNDLKTGHINLLVKRALGLGYNIFDMLSCCTINPIRHYNLDCGLLQEGDKADFILVDDLNQFNVKQTYIDGELVAEAGVCLFDSVDFTPVNKFVTNKKKEEDFKVTFTGGKIRVIEIIPSELMTKEIHLTPKVLNSNITADTERDILKIAVVNRYQDSPPAIGFIKGFGIKSGAAASSVAHDSHNIVCIGADDKSMADAVNTVIENRGGLSVIDRNDSYSLQLSVGGIMSEERCEQVAEKYESIENKVRELGSGLRAPMMTMSFMALIVIPNLKLSDKGLFDINKFDFAELAC